MRKGIIYALKLLVFSILWGVLVFSQHVICFDFFNSNLWYLYLLAVLVAVLHYSMLYGIHINMNGKIVYALGILYTVFTLVKVYQLLNSFKYQPYPLGLTILCALLDGIGAILAYKMSLVK